MLYDKTSKGGILYNGDFFLVDDLENAKINKWHQQNKKQYGVGFCPGVNCIESKKILNLKIEDICLVIDCHI